MQTAYELVAFGRGNVVDVVASKLEDWVVVVASSMLDEEQSGGYGRVFLLASYYTCVEHGLQIVAGMAMCLGVVEYFVDGLQWFQPLCTGLVVDDAYLLLSVGAADKVNTVDASANGDGGAKCRNRHWLCDVLFQFDDGGSEDENEESEDD